MSGQHADDHACVGPVLAVGLAGEAIVDAIKDLNAGVRVVDRGAYLRVLVPRRCIVTCHAIEEHLGRRFCFPGDLEKVMVSFKGALRLSEEEAIWQFATAAQ